MGSTTEQCPADDSTPEDWRTYLQLIEDAVGRMAAEANTLKAWLVPVVTAAYGYAIVAHSWVVALVGTAATCIVGFQAAHYLRQEKAFRALYKSAVAHKVAIYTLDIGRISDGQEDSDAQPALMSPLVIAWPATVFSWSVGGFFGPIAVGGVLIAALCH